MCIKRKRHKKAIRQGLLIILIYLFDISLNYLQIVKAKTDRRVMYISLVILSVEKASFVTGKLDTLLENGMCSNIDWSLNKRSFYGVCFKHNNNTNVNTGQTEQYKRTHFPPCKINVDYLNEEFISYSLQVLLQSYFYFQYIKFI